MGEIVLLTGLYTALGNTLSQLFLSEGSTVVGTVASEAEPQPGEQADERLSLIEWNRTSPISAHNVILEVLKRHERIDRVILIFDTTKDNRALHEISLTEIDSYIDGRFKGITFLLKELIHYYQRQNKSGEISLVLHSEGAKVLPPLDGMGTGAFRALGNSLFNFYQNESVTINGFESSTSESEEYAEFIRKNIREKRDKAHGKWFRFQEKGMLNALGNLGITGKR